MAEVVRLGFGSYRFGSFMSDALSTCSDKCPLLLP
jgi:hypothetical protein